MKKRLYLWLIMLHPPQFRRRFGDEILCIFDEADCGATQYLLTDGVISLLRQWVLRSGFPLILTALLGAGVEVALGSFVWFGAIQPVLAGSFAPTGGPQTLHDTGMFLLLTAGLITAIVSGAVVLAVLCMRCCIGKDRAKAQKVSMPGHLTTVIPLISAMCLCAARLMQGQSPAARPEFEVASVKLNAGGCEEGRGGGRGGAPAAGRLSVRCITLGDLIQAAYGTFANGPNPNQSLVRILGAPGWVESDTYDIEATPAGPATIDQIYGPMLQRLLEDRFQLKIHRETRELPAYALTIAKGGSKLQISKEGSCTVFDPSHPPARPERGQPTPAFCGRTSFGRNGEMVSVDGFGLSMALFAGTTLSARLNLDRPVIDKTGLDGIFDIHLKFAPDTPASAPAEADRGAAVLDSGPSLFAALQEQLGLKLTPDKAPVEVLVVDRIERPSAN